MPTINYLRVDCEHDAANRNENYRQDHQTDKKRMRPTYIPINLNKPPNMTNNTSTDVIFEGSQCNRVVTKQEDSHSIVPTEKQINE